MDKEQVSFLGYSAVALLVVMAGFMFFRVSQDADIYFARQVFSGLVNGSQSVEKTIDWLNFKTIGSDIGADYARFPTQAQKGYFRKSFIINFSLSFKNSGGELRSFTNWAIYSRDNNKAVVSALNLTNKALLFTVSKKGSQRKLVAIQWKE